MTKHMYAIASPVLLSLVIASCAVSTSTSYSGSASSDEQVATISKDWGCSLCVDQILAADGQLLYDVRRDGRKDPFKLNPGIYLIRIAFQAPKIPRVSFQGTVDLKASHVYRVQNETCFAWGVLTGALFGGTCRGRHGYTGTVWIEDAATGEVVVGEKWS